MFPPTYQINVDQWPELFYVLKEQITQKKKKKNYLISDVEGEGFLSFPDSVSDFILY